MGIYEELGVRTVINACATVTRLGGSLMPPEVLEAMAEAARSFVDVNELHQKVGQRIAQLTGNEAAYVSSGAAGGLALATAACITGRDPAKIAQLPNSEGLKDEVVIHRSHRIRFDQAVRQVGAKLVEFGYPSHTFPWELEAAINEKTAAVVYIAVGFARRPALPLEEVIEIAHRREVPIIVDAAAQLPPVENLRRFTAMGADLALFSGGKDLRGPQCSGLILGRRELIEACALNGNPNLSIGRPMKVGKEEILGLLAAVERYINLDHGQRARDCEEVVQYLVQELSSLAHVTARRDFPNEAGQPLPRALVTFEDDLGMTRDVIIGELQEGEPCIAVAPAGKRGVFINPMTMEKGEEEIVARRLKEILHHSG